MIDARGLSCPMPVIMVQKEVKAANPKEIEVLVDNRTAVENISRFAGHAGYEISVQPDGEDFSLKLTKG